MKISCHFAINLLVFTITDIKRNSKPSKLFTQNRTESKRHYYLISNKVLVLILSLFCSKSALFVYRVKQMTFILFG